MSPATASDFTFDAMKVRQQQLLHFDLALMRHVDEGTQLLNEETHTIRLEGTLHQRSRGVHSLLHERQGLPNLGQRDVVPAANGAAPAASSRAKGTKIAANRSAVLTNGADDAWDSSTSRTIWL